MAKVFIHISVETKRKIFYMLFGGLTTLVNFLLYFVLRQINLSIALSTALAWTLAVLFAYTVNKKYVFKSNVKNTFATFKELILFFACRLMSGGLDMLFMIVFADILQYNETIVKIISSFFVVVINYIASKLIVFK